MKLKVPTLCITYKRLFWKLKFAHESQLNILQRSPAGLNVQRLSRAKFVLVSHIGAFPEPCRPSSQSPEYPNIMMVRTETNYLSDRVFRPPTRAGSSVLALYSSLTSLAIGFLFHLFLPLPPFPLRMFLAKRLCSTLRKGQDIRTSSCLVRVGGCTCCICTKGWGGGVSLPRGRSSKQ